MEESDTLLDAGPAWRYARCPKQVIMFDSDDVPRVLLVSSLGTNCGEEARGRLSSGGNGDGDPEGDLEQLCFVSSDVYISSPPSAVKKVEFGQN